MFYGVAGHHFIELLFQTKRYPTPRLGKISTQLAQRPIKFAAGEEPWSPYEVDEQRIAIVSSRDGWQVYTREEDVRQGDIAEEGTRRYEAWEVMEEVRSGLGKNREDIIRLVGMEGLVSLTLNKGAKNGPFT
jgi:hypothetical protein